MVKRKGTKRQTIIYNSIHRNLLRLSNTNSTKNASDFHMRVGGRRGHDRMVVGFTTTYAIDVVHSTPAQGKEYNLT